MKFTTNDRFMHMFTDDGRMIAVASLSDITFRYSMIVHTVMIEAVNAVFEIAFNVDLDTWETEECKQAEQSKP